MMEKYKDFVITQTCVPAYLTDVLQSNEDIILVHCKKNPGKPSETKLSDISLNSTMNLTGSPLEVDLNVLPSAAAYHLSAHTNSNEVEHVPMKLQTARIFLRDYKNSEELLINPKAIYCVCDGNDDKHTVVLGSYQSGGDIVRTLIFLEDCVDETYPANNINRMMQKHVENVGSKTAKIEVKVTCIYELHGFKLSDDYVFEALENTGSVLIEGCWNLWEYKIPQYGAEIKMMLQAIIGHENSVMHSFFQELVFLEHCLKTLYKKQDNFDDAVISCSPFDVADLNQRISDALHEVSGIRRPSTVPNNLQDAIQNISETKIINKLYNVLKCCQTGSDLRICMSRLFEIVGDSTLRLQVFNDDNKTIIGKMIHDIYSGKMIIPYLSTKQSLQLLIESGIQILKQNYFSIIKSANFTVSELLIQNWNDIGSVVSESRRGTFADLDLNRGSLQLQFLLRVHVLLEFLQLVEQNCCFSKDVGLCVMKHAYNKYVMENTLVELLISDTKQLHDLVVPLTFTDVKQIEDCSPMKWQIKMTSVQKYSSVVTVFQYSKKPLFSNTVHESYDPSTSIADVKEKFFVTRLESYGDKIF